MPTEVKNSGVAIVLSVFYPGLGHLYAGRIGRGVLMFCVTPVVYALAIFGGGISLFAGGVAATEAETAAAGGLAALLGIGFIVSAFAWWLFVLVDARKCCEQFNANNPESPQAV
jgi:hypothetical protein